MVGAPLGTDEYCEVFWEKISFKNFKNQFYSYVNGMTLNERFVYSVYVLQPQQIISVA